MAKMKSLKPRPKDMSDRGLVIHLLCAARGAWGEVLRGEVRLPVKMQDTTLTRREEMVYRRELMRRLKERFPKATKR